MVSVIRSSKEVIFAKILPEQTPVKERFYPKAESAMIMSTSVKRVQWQLPVKENCPLSIRVQRSLAAWMRIGAPKKVINWLKYGYRLPFVGQVLPFCGRTWVPPDDLQFQAMRALKLKLLAQGVTVPAICNQFVSTCRLEPKKDSDEFRLIVDLRILNTYLLMTTCKFETLKSLEFVLEDGDWMVSFDLKSGYYHVPVHPAYQKFLTCVMDGDLVSFTALPFGLATAPLVFTKIMRPMVAFMRARGIRIHPYIDDFLIMARTQQSVLLARDMAAELLDSLGLTRNEDKGHWEPTQRLRHLGLIINTVSMVFEVPQQKLVVLQGAAKRLLRYASDHCRWVAQKSLQKVLGTATSLALAIPQSRLRTRALYDSISVLSRDVQLSNQAMRDLLWWSAIPQEFQSRKVCFKQSTRTFTTDASDFGWGGVDNMRNITARGYFSPQERKLHITAKELRAVELTFQAFLSDVIVGSTVLVVTDNMATMACLAKWTSSSPTLMEVLRRIAAAVWERDIHLVSSYIPSAENVLADTLSRKTDPHDWSLDPSWLRSRTGSCSIDLFATSTNHVCQRFCSQQLGLGSLGDAFGRSWVGEIAWVNPPWPLIPRILKKLVIDSASAMLLLPLWPSALWWPAVVRYGRILEVIGPEDLRRLVRKSNPATPSPLKSNYWSLALIRWR